MRYTVEMKVPPTEAARLLVQARRAAGLTQTELARRAGMAHSVLSAYEHGRREPGVAALDRLLRAAGYRLTLTRRGPDPEKVGRILPQLLRLADALPKRPRGRLEFPSFE
jgi:hypothetical protein